MKPFLGLLLISAVCTSWAAETTSSVVVVRTLSEDHATRIEIAPVPGSSDYSLNYTVRSKGEDLKSDKKISQSVAKTLMDILAQGKHPYAKWVSDKLCGNKNLWHVDVSGNKKTICRNEYAVKNLESFLASVANLSH